LDEFDEIITGARYFNSLSNSCHLPTCNSHHTNITVFFTA